MIKNHLGALLSSGLPNETNNIELKLRKDKKADLSLMEQNQLRERNYDRQDSKIQWTGLFNSDPLYERPRKLVPLSKWKKDSMANQSNLDPKPPTEIKPAANGQRTSNYEKINIVTDSQSPQSIYQSKLLPAQLKIESTNANPIQPFRKTPRRPAALSLNADSFKMLSSYNNSKNVTPQANIKNKQDVFLPNKKSQSQMNSRENSISFDESLKIPKKSNLLSLPQITHNGWNPSQTQNISIKEDASALDRSEFAAPADDANRLKQFQKSYVRYLQAHMLQHVENESRIKTQQGEVVESFGEDDRDLTRSSFDRKARVVGYSSKINENSTMVCWRLPKADSKQITPEPRFGATLTSVNNCAVLIGGTGRNISNYDTYVYKYMKGSWKSANESPSGTIVGHTAVEYRNSVFVFGGEVQENEKDAPKVVNELREFNPQSLKWTSPLVTKSTQISPRKHHAACIYKHTMIVYGGIGSSGEYLGDVWVYNFGKRCVLSLG